ncbi:MAG: hypothetical protein ACP5E5_04620 [Acidobacteriaceae bacterium]
MNGGVLRGGGEIGRARYALVCGVEERGSERRTSSGCGYNVVTSLCSDGASAEALRREV